ncbi:MAG TPA: hypothetical protein VHV09_18190 [Trebonia sp.]|nr:hypothetical protein [Trebonia sp.]
MFVILAILAVLLVGLLVLAARGYAVARGARRSAERREAVAARLDAVVEQAAKEHQARTDAARASAALTTVLPAIKQGDQAPRRVA